MLTIPSSHESEGVLDTALYQGTTSFEPKWRCSAPLPGFSGTEVGRRRGADHGHDVADAGSENQDQEQGHDPNGKVSAACAHRREDKPLQQGQ